MSTPDYNDRLLEHDDVLLTDEQTAALLGVCLRTLLRWDSFGDGPPSIRIGRKRRRRLKAVRQWLLARERQGSVERVAS
jgi:hypothetical protein